jgi:hypothetical protein
LRADRYASSLHRMRRKNHGKAPVGHVFLTADLSIQTE